MSEHTTDPKDPRLGHGPDAGPVPQNKAYLVLPEAERAKGYVRPLRYSYVHVGIAGPQNPLRDLDAEEKERYGKFGYFKYEAYPQPRPDGSSVTGKFWTEAELNSIGKGCGTKTTMSHAISETYARKPTFYGSTYCCGCSRHLAVAEFVWDGTQERVGS